MVKKLEKIDLINKQNKNNIDNIKKINIKINSEDLLKRIIEIPIVINYTVSPVYGGGPIG